MQKILLHLVAIAVHTVVVGIILPPGIDRLAVDVNEVGVFSVVVTDGTATTGSAEGAMDQDAFGMAADNLVRDGHEVIAISWEDIQYTVAHMANLHRLTGGNPDPKLWQQPMRRLTGVALEHLTRLLEPRSTGARARREGGPAATVIADSSNYCVGYRVQFHVGPRAGQTIRGRIPFTHTEWRQRHHTHLEAIGLGLVLEMTMKYGELRGDEIHYIWINSYQDNQAAVKNFNRPGGKVHMVNGTMKSKWMAMERYIQLPVQYGSKELMDDHTRCVLKCGSS